MKYTLPFFNKRLVTGFAIAVLAIVLAVVIFHKNKSNVTKTLPQVTIGKAIRKSLPLEVKLPGTTQSQETVLVRSQIDGLIKEVFAQEGKIIQKDAPLFAIDDAPLQAQLHQAEATLAKNTALLEDARKETKRNLPLLKKGFVTQSSFDQIVANEKSLDGQVKADQAAIDLIKVQLGYAKIQSPIAGLIGFYKVRTGNFVRAAENTPLVSVVKIDPLEAVFNLPERYLKYLANKDLTAIQVKLFDMNGDPISQKASVVALDNSVDATSGVIPVKLNIENLLINDRPSLLPGQYVITILQLAQEENSLVIPLSAVQNGQNGSNIFVYKPETQTVEFRPVKLGIVTETEAVIQEGVQENEQVVTSGQIRLTDKIKVSVLTS